MKYLLQTSLVLLSFLLGCKSQQPVVQNAMPVGMGTEVITPCVDESYDDSEYFRGLGTGTNLNIGNSRSAALASAQSEIQGKLAGFVNGLTSDYSRTMAGDSGEKTQRAMEGELFKVVSKNLNDASKICEKTLQNQRGVYNTFIVLEIPKKEMLDQMVNTLSDNEELEVEFNRDQFRKFAEEKMKAIQEARKN